MGKVQNDELIYEANTAKIYDIQTPSNLVNAGNCVFCICITAMLWSEYRMH